MKIRRDKRDALFSLIIRERAGWVCERCGKQFSREDGQGLHCSHFIGRRHRSTRWHPDNAAAHCFTCHQYLGEHPLAFTDWILSHLGEKRARAIRMMAQVVAKFSKRDLENIYSHMKLEHDRLRISRVAKLPFKFLPAPEIAALRPAWVG